MRTLLQFYLACSIVLPVCLLVAILAGCAGTVAAPLPSSNTAQFRSDAVPGLPFQIDIEKEWNDGGRLYLSGSVRIEPEVPAGTAVLRMRVFGQKGLENETFQSIEIPPFVQGQKRATAFVIALPFTSLTDYQIELLWGADAIPFISNAKAPVLSSPLEVRSVDFRPAACAGGNCEHGHVIEAQLYNTGTTAVSSVILGLIMISSDTSTAPGAEEEISVTGLNLPPGGSQKLRLLIAEPLTDTIRPLMEPQIRVVSYASQ